jgi:hypothetical protein
MMKSMRVCSTFKRSVAPSRGVNSFRSLLTGLALALCGAAACSSGNGAGTGGTGAVGVGGAGVPSALVFNPCPTDTNLGSFAITLVSEAVGSQLGGQVKDSVAPADKSTMLAQEGPCRIMLGPDLVCGTMCVSGNVCAGNNVCIPAPATVKVGTVNVTGLGSAVSIAEATKYYSPIAKTSYPPYVAGNSIALMSTGGVYAPLSMAVRGIAPLDVPEQALPVSADQPLTVTWTAVPETAGAGNIEITMDIAHHGGVAAQLVCDWPDTGTGTVPGTLITKLIERGTAGFPIIGFTRESVDSAAVANGCVEFKVLSHVERFLMVDGVISCGDLVTPPLLCPTGMTCGTDKKCHG